MPTLIPPVPPHTVHDDGALRIMVQGNVLAVCNREPPSLRGLERLLSAIDTLHAERRGRISIVVVPQAEQPRLTADVARAIAEGWRVRDPLIACGAAWLRRTGFVAAALRSLVSGVLLTRPSTATPVRVSADLDEIATFVEGHGEQAYELRGLLEAVIA